MYLHRNRAKKKKKTEQTPCSTLMTIHVKLQTVGNSEPNHSQETNSWIKDGRAQAASRCLFLALGLIRGEMKFRKLIEWWSWLLAFDEWKNSWGEVAEAWWLKPDGRSLQFSRSRKTVKFRFLHFSTTPDSIAVINGLQINYQTVSN